MLRHFNVLNIGTLAPIKSQSVKIIFIALFIITLKRVFNKIKMLFTKYFENCIIFDLDLIID